MPLITYAFIAIILAVSLFDMNNQHSLFEKYALRPNLIVYKKQYYRIISHGFLHADFSHLIFNLISFFSFSKALEEYFKETLFREFSEQIVSVYFLLFILSALCVSVIYVIFKNKNRNEYSAIGFSGAVTAVIFACIMIRPDLPILVLFFEMPAWLFGPLYIAFEIYSARQNNSNIGHEAHLGGAFYGILFILVFNFEYYINLLHKITQ